MGEILDDILDEFIFDEIFEEPTLVLLLLLLLLLLVFYLMLRYDKRRDDKLLAMPMFYLYLLNEVDDYSMLLAFADDGLLGQIFELFNGIDGTMLATLIFPLLLFPLFVLLFTILLLLSLLAPTNI